MTKSNDSKRCGLKDAASVPFGVFDEALDAADEGDDNPFFLRRDVPPAEFDADEDDDGSVYKLVLYTILKLVDSSLNNFDSVGSLLVVEDAISSLAKINRFVI